MSNSTSDPLKQIEPHKEYFIPGADLHLLVGTVMFRVHSYFFERDSVMFKDMLHGPIPPNTTRPGSSDSQPLVIKNSSPKEFAHLCWVFYNSKYSDYSTAATSDWMSILKIACEYKFIEVQHCAIRGLQKCDLTTVDRIHVYELYKADSQYLAPLYVEMAMRDEPPSNAEVDKLGSKTSLSIFRLREHLRSRPGGMGGVSPLPAGIDEEDAMQAVCVFLGIDSASQNTGNTKTKKDKKQSSGSSSSKGSKSG